MTNRDITIAPGSYTLARDVKNPEPDRREKYDWRKRPMWKTGAQFIVREMRDGNLIDADYLAGLSPDARAKLEADRTYTVVEMIGDRWPGLHRVGPGHVEQYAALAEALVVVEETDDHFLARIDCRDRFASWLVASKRVTREEFEALWWTYEHGDGSDDL